MLIVQSPRVLAMRLRITLGSPNGFGEIPINYNSYVSQFVYELLQPDTPFEHQSATGSTQYGIPYYTFSNLYIPGVDQREQTLRFGQVPIDLTVSLLVDPQAEKEVEERLRAVPVMDFEGTTLQVDQIERLPEQKTFARRARFRMLSPLASPLWPMSNEGTELRYIHYNDPAFSESIRAILLARYERWKGKRPQDTRFHLSLDHQYIQRRRGRISKLVTFYPGLPEEKKIKAIVAPFEVEGNPELIWLGYVAGFGERNILGFGCSDVIRTPTMNERPIYNSGNSRQGNGVGGNVQRFDYQMG